MTDEELREYNKGREIRQLGIVVADLDEAIEKWTNNYKVGPWFHLDITSENCRDLVRTDATTKEKFAYRVAASYIGNLQIELIEANETVPLYQDYLNKTGQRQALHHFKEKIPYDEHEKVAEEFAAMGMPDIFSAKLHNIRFLYPDTTDKIGVQVEFGCCGKMVIPEDEK